MNMRKFRQSKGFLIAVSILSSVILWLYVDSTDERQINSQLITVPVEFLGEEDVLAQRGLMLTDGQDVTVRFRLTGIRERISEVNTKRDQFRVQVDLTVINTIGQHTLDYDVIFPDTLSEADFTYDYISPKTITVTVAEMYQTQVPIRCELVGEAADGYMVDEPQLSPDYLTVSGLQKDVSQVDHAEVTVDITDAKEEVLTVVDFVLVDHEGNELDRELYRTDVQNIQVTVPVLLIKELPLEINFIESPGSTRDHVASAIFPPSVTVAGDSKSLSTLESLVIATIDLSDLTEDTTLQIPIPLPANSRLLDGESTATVTISFLGLETQSFTTSNISYINPPDDRNVSVVTKEMEVLLRGPQEELEMLSEHNIRLVADLSDISTASGNYAVPATVYVDGTEEVGAIGQYQIVVRISK